MAWHCAVTHTEEGLQWCKEKASSLAAMSGLLLLKFSACIASLLIAGGDMGARMHVSGDWPCPRLFGRLAMLKGKKDEEGARVHVLCECVCVLLVHSCDGRLCSVQLR